MPTTKGFRKRGSSKLSYKRAKKATTTTTMDNINASQQQLLLDLGLIKSVDNNIVNVNEDSDATATSDVDVDDDDDITTNNMDRVSLEINCGQPLLDNRRSKRLAIAYLFVNKYNTPPQCEWDDIPNKIKDELMIPIGTCFHNILLDILLCQSMGTTYHGDSYVDHKEIRLDRRLLKVDSNEAQLIADCIEDGLSLRLTAHVINASQKEANLPTFTLSTIYNCIKMMQPKSFRIKKKTR
jgi:hypothetical protein